MAFDFFKRLRQPLAEVKSVTLPELLLTYSRSAPIFQKWDTETAIEQGLKASAIFYACVDRRAKSIAQVPWKAYRKQRDGSLVAAPESPLQRLIDKPNPDFAWADIRTLAVLPFENSTSRFELTQELHEVLSRELPRSLGVRPAAEEFADAVVRGTIVNYSQDTPSYRASDPGSPPEVFIRQVSLSIRVEIIDRVENVVLWDNSGLSGRGDYLESEIEDVGRAEAIRQLVQQIVDGAQSNW
jgi:hypothetical protein